MTGAEGLIGSAVINRLRLAGVHTRLLDIKSNCKEYCGDIADADFVQEAVSGCDGVIHAAALSRVCWGELQPELCQQTNVRGVRNVVAAIERLKSKPWLIFLSSREVYGIPAKLPVAECHLLRPVNVYGRSKVAGEALVQEAKAKGVQAYTVRLSNVYGSTADHADRVIPAFIGAALSGEALRLDGHCSFDFTHKDDVAAAILIIADLASRGVSLPPIHLVSGVSTTLHQLARMIIDRVSSPSLMRNAAPRTYDVPHFQGSPELAKKLLGWHASTPLIDGLRQLVTEYRTLRQA
ncbi:MAG: NAD-dependent epimerase/dehydratase family protein [Gammaproteobacteria bacterium]